MDHEVQQFTKLLARLALRCGRQINTFHVLGSQVQLRNNHGVCGVIELSEIEAVMREIKSEEERP